MAERVKADVASATQKQQAGEVSTISDTTDNSIGERSNDEITAHRITMLVQAIGTRDRLVRPV